MPRGGVDVLLYSSFNLVARWGWVVNATPWQLYPGERPGTRFIGDWVGPMEGLDGCGKFRPPTGIASPDRPACSEVAIPTELSRPLEGKDRGSQKQGH